MEVMVLPQPDGQEAPGGCPKLGSSKPWPEVLEKITGQTEVSTKAFMTYFRPLRNWLVTENVQQGEILGWPDFSSSFEEQCPHLCLGRSQCAWAHLQPLHSRDGLVQHTHLLPGLLPWGSSIGQTTPFQAHLASLLPPYRGSQDNFAPPTQEATVVALPSASHSGQRGPHQACGSV
ncbi:Angiotensin-converting enzyme [Manis javanica]|nr:Angiotensin-converting enzyme [Manis javanica]